ncbi:XPA binding protein 2 family protein, partial [Toxoplasma gondii TgCatPRC2]
MPPAVATAPDEGASSHHASSSEAVAGGEASVSLDEFNFVTKETDIVYEQELQRDPFQVKVWVGYLNSKKDAPPYTRFLLYERALRGLPGSYKLWFAYLKERVASLSSHDPLEDSRPFEEANVVFERALVHLSRMPKIWMLFVDFLKRQKLLTRTRRAFDRALQSLAVTQHDQVWDRYIQFVK